MSVRSSSAVGVLLFVSFWLPARGQPGEALEVEETQVESSAAVADSSTRELQRRRSLAKLFSALKKKPISPFDAKDTGIDTPERLPVDASGETLLTAQTLPLHPDRYEYASTELNGPGEARSLEDARPPIGRRNEKLVLESDRVGSLSTLATSPLSFESEATTAIASADPNGENLMTKTDDFGLLANLVDQNDLTMAAISDKSQSEVNLAGSTDNSDDSRQEGTAALDNNNAMKEPSSSPSRYHGINWHADVSSSFAQTAKISAEQLEDSRRGSRIDITKDSFSGGIFESSGLLLKSIYYDGVLALSVPMRPIAMSLLFFCIAFPCFCLYKTRPVEKERNRYTRKGRVVYEWKDTSEAAVLFTKLPSGVTSKELEIKFWQKHLKIGRSGKLPFLREELFSSVVVNECTWEVSGDELTVILHKDVKESWPCVFRAHLPGGRSQVTTLL